MIQNIRALALKATGKSVRTLSRGKAVLAQLFVWARSAAGVCIIMTGAGLVFASLPVVFLYNVTPKEPWRLGLMEVLAATYVIGYFWWLLLRWRNHYRYIMLVLLTYPMMAASCLIVGYAEWYMQFGIIDTATREQVSDPTTSLYFSITTFTTLGYGDFAPSKGARLIAGSEAIVGVIVFAAFVAAFARILTILLGPAITNVVSE